MIGTPHTPAALPGRHTHSLIHSEENRARPPWRVFAALAMICFGAPVKFTAYNVTLSRLRVWPCSRRLEAGRQAFFPLGIWRGPAESHHL